MKREFTAFEEKIDTKLVAMEQRMGTQLDSKVEEIKDVMYTLVDQMMQEIQEMRVERTATDQLVPILRTDVDDHEDRLTDVEQEVGAIVLRIA